MTNDKDGSPTLAEAMVTWCAGQPERLSVADVIAALAETGARVATLIAGSPLATTRAGSPASGSTNASGDEQKMLDVQSEEIFVAALADCDVAAICSEETEEAILVRPGGRLVVALDPIDGSSNIDINAPIGTIFTILPTTGFEEDPVAALLQTGRHQIAAGMIIYGPSTVMALTWGDGTDIYALDPESRTFIRTHHRLVLSSEAHEFAINASNARHWGPGIRAYVTDLVNGELGPRERDFNMRWLASLVAETYRILLRGGIFLYPSDERPGYGEGRIRLVYEANPVAFLCEQAGGAATDGDRLILDLQPTDLHQRIPFVFGSRNKVDRVRRYLLAPPTLHDQSPLFSQRGLFRT